MDYSSIELTPKKSGTGRMFNKNPTKVPLKKGCFIDGVWHCNCSPRLPASHFQVKKVSPNKGRWFYTCQEPKEKSCGFFLWDDDAKAREMKAVLDNSRSEAGSSTFTVKPSSRTHDKGVSGGHPTSKENKVTTLDNDDDDEFGDWPLTTADEVEEVERAASMRPPETPRKAVKTGIFATPGSKRVRSGEDSWPTPATNPASRAKDIFTTPTTIRLQPSESDNASIRGIISPSASPTPNRRLDFGSLTTTGASGSADYDITEEVLGLLNGQPIESDVITSVRHVLNQYSLKTSGIQKGRDVTRLALKARDAKIEELQQQIATLESQREMDKAIIRHFKDDMSASVVRRGPRRGRGS